jgi:hypothetical protein
MANLKNSAAAVFRAAAAFRRKNPRRLAVLVAAALVLGAAAAFFALRPRPAFLVEKAHVTALRAALAGADAPKWRTLEFDPADGPPASGGRYGYLITTAAPGGAPTAPAGKDAAGPPTVHRDLPRTREAGGAVPLAVDPWLVFRRHTSPVLTRERLETRKKDRGVLLLPGGERDAVWAWAAQELQEKPGEFPRESGLWHDRMDRLPRDGRFQQGALTYTWEDVWPRLFGGEIAWVYAPLSRIQAFPGSRTSPLEGDRFPEREGWNEYGIHARILWAVPFGDGKAREKMKSAADWLGRAETQTVIAGTLKWAPAHRAAKPVNPLALAAQKAWSGSSFVWEASSNADKK